MGKPGRRPIGRLRFRRLDNIKIDVQERELGVWTAQGQVMGSCEVGNELLGSLIKCWVCLH